MDLHRTNLESNMNFCIYCIRAYYGNTKYVIGGTKDFVCCHMVIIFNVQ